MFQAATGRLRRKMNQCMETSISMVDRHWPTISGITHWKDTAAAKQHRHTPDAS